MPTENDLRDLFANADAPTSSIDPKRVIARSRARRLPRQLAAGAVGALAITGVSVLAIQVSQVPSPATMTAGEAYDQSAPAPEIDSIKRAPADKVNLCAGSLAEVAPSQYGLQLDVTFPATAPVGTEPVTGTVLLTNTSDREVIGSTAATPVLTLSQNGTVLWHTNGAMVMSLVTVDLQPGESLEYSASFAPVRCDVDDDLADSFRADLPPVPAGDYQLSALIDFTADPVMKQQTTELDLVSGPLSAITLY